METYGPEWVDAQVAKTIDLWRDCGRDFGGSPRHYDEGEQEANERAYDAELEALERKLERIPETRADRDGLERQLVESFARFSTKALELDPEAIELLTREFLPIGTELARWARQFDPELSMGDIIQAARNAWTAAGLQPLLNARVRLTPSILGYSLLYPYSDNYLDDASISSEQKLRFSQRFRRRLCGENFPAEDKRERALEDLIALVEMQYPRGRFPCVFECLLAIHHAQEQSIRQLESGGDSLRLSCAKGGTSVLADACLARGWLNPEESRFAFEWGVLLQLGDDVQDVVDDLRRGSMTLFSSAAAAGKPLDWLTIQLLQFSERVANHMDELPYGTASLKSLLKMSWRSLIIRAVADSHQFFSPFFLAEAERSSPFRFEFLRARRNRLASREGLYAKLFNAFIEIPTPDRPGQLEDGEFACPLPQISRS